MARHLDFGKKGEELAAGWLVDKGYEILHRNWRYGRNEVDIIARQGSVVHFIEVKAGRSGAYGRPEEKVGKNKIKNMMRAATGWLYQFPGIKRVQYDVLAITFRKDAEPEYFLFGDVYA